MKIFLLFSGERLHDKLTEKKCRGTVLRISAFIVYNYVKTSSMSETECYKKKEIYNVTYMYFQT